MVNQHMILHFHIADRIYIKFLLAALHGNREILFYPRFYIHKSPCHRFREREIRNWFQHIIHGIYLISLDRILRHIRSKNKKYSLVKFPDFLSCTHSIKKCHLNIHQNQIIVRRVICNDVLSIFKFCNVKFLSVLFPISFKTLPQRFSVRFAVIHDCNTNHIVFHPCNKIFLS